MAANPNIQPPVSSAPAPPTGYASTSAPTGLPTPAPSAPTGYATTTTGLQPGSGQPSDVGYNGNVPGAGENVSNSYLNMYGAMGTPQTSNDAQQAYTQFQNSTPADTSSYYANAQRLQDNALNTQMAARGSYGSSNAVGQLSAADTNLAAQQANANAQYGLQRATLGGQLASGADASSLAQSNNDQNWMKGISDLAFENQKEGTARAELGLQDTKTAADTLSGIEGSVGQQEIATQQKLLEEQLISQGMSASDAATAAQNQLANSTQTGNNQAAVTASMLAYFV